MTFEEWLSRTPAGPEPEAPCFQWGLERISDQQKAVAGDWPWGILSPFTDREIQFSGTKSCCRYWERIYNLQIAICPNAVIPDGYPFPETNKIKLEDFVKLLHRLGHKDGANKYPLMTRVDAIDGSYENPTFISFTHEFTPLPITYYPKLRGLQTVIRFSLKWRTC